MLIKLAPVTGTVMRLLYVVACIITLVGCSKEIEHTESPIRPIAWTAVKTSNFEQVRTLSGIVAPVENASLSFEVNGKVEKVFVKLGDTVSKGQPLAKLNQLTFQLSFESASAQVKQAEATLQEAQNEYERYKTLSEQGLVSKSGFDNSKSAFESAKSAVDVANAQLNIARKNVQDSELLAPYDGVITKRLIEPSQQVAAGQSVFEIEGQHGFEVRVMVPESIIHDLNSDMTLKVTYPVMPQLSMKGHISEKGTRAESANAFPVTVILDEENSVLRAGMTAEVEFVYQGVGRTGYTGPSIRIPVSALGADIKQKAFVFVFDPNTQLLEKRFVQTENVINNQVIISNGLKDDEIIATAGIAFLRDGQKVSLLDNAVQRFN